MHARTRAQRTHIHRNEIVTTMSRSSYIVYQICYMVYKISYIIYQISNMANKISYKVYKILICGIK